MVRLGERESRKKSPLLVGPGTKDEGFEAVWDFKGCLEWKQAWRKAVMEPAGAGHRVIKTSPRQQSRQPAPASTGLPPVCKLQQWGHMAAMKGIDPSHDNRLKAPCNVGDSGLDPRKAGLSFPLGETGRALSRTGPPHPTPTLVFFLDQPSRNS